MYNNEDFEYEEFLKTLGGEWWISKESNKEFIKNLTRDEEREFLFKEIKLRGEMDSLLKEYNKIASDRVSRDVLLNIINDQSSNHYEKIKPILSKMDNKNIQCLSEILRIILKETS